MNITICLPICENIGCSACAHLVRDGNGRYYCKIFKKLGDIDIPLGDIVKLVLESKK